MIKRGVGFGSGWQGVNLHFGHPDVSSVNLEITEDLRFQIGVAAEDMGQGITETCIHILSQEFNGISADRFDFLDPDTGVTPDGGPTGASRQTAITGNAVKEAAQKLIHVLKIAASELCESPPKEVEFKNGALYGRDGKVAALSEVVTECKRIGLPLSVVESFQGPSTEALDEKGQGFGVNQFSYATYVSEVEVDTLTGEVKVLRITAFIDAGRIIRRRGAEMQVEGGITMAIGHTLMEEFKMQDGRPITDSLTTYLVPTIYDVPTEIDTSFVDKPVPMGTLEAKGLAELVLVPVAPSIISAIYDAVGVHITSLPATPERVLSALEDKQCEDYGD